MRLVTFTTGDDARAGIAVGDQIIDLASSGFEDVLSFLEAGDAAVVTARDLVTSPREVFGRSDVELLAPVPHHRNLFVLDSITLITLLSQVRRFRLLQ